MKIVMIGESAKHKDELLANMADKPDVITLPASAAFSNEYDSLIEPDDIVVSLRYKRCEGAKPGFKMLHVPGAGLDGIDTESLPDGCILCNVYEHQVPIAEYVILSMLEWEIRAFQMRTDFSAERWPSLYSARVPHGELFAKTVGLVGFGGIAREIAKRAKAFGMKVVAVDKFASDESHLTNQLLKNEALDELLAMSDFVVLSCPLTDETREWIDAEKLSKMKASGVLINISRGWLVNPKDLYDAVKENRIAGAVLDVWWNYPKSPTDKVLPADHPFWELSNVVCTPHSCAWTHELTQRRYAVIARNIENLRRGEPLRNVVRYSQNEH